jgi:microcystin-dependent protein
MPFFSPKITIPFYRPKTDDDNYANMVAIERAINNIDSVPAGAMFDFPGPESTIPIGYYVLGGQSIPVSGNPTLFGMFGTTYGSVDSTHFNLPDARGRVLVGLDNMGGVDAGRLDVPNTLGGSGGEQYHTLSIGELAAHAHGVNDPQHYHGPADANAPNFVGHAVAASSYAGANGINFGFRDAATTAYAFTGISIQNNGSNTPHNTMQPYILVNKIIKAG